MNTTWRTRLGVLACLALAGCGKAGPTAPSGPAAAPFVSGPRILLAGNSGAYFLAPFLPEAIDLSMIDAPIDYWLSNRDFAERARSMQLLAFVWWQGWTDPRRDTPADEYAQQLRSLIAIARTGTPGLPVRIIEVLDRPDRAVVRDAQRQVAGDPGVELIPTADLEYSDAAGHLTPQGYQSVRDRIYRSLGR